jgi:hypothetical protein
LLVLTLSKSIDLVAMVSLRRSGCSALRNEAGAGG